MTGRAGLATASAAVARPFVGGGGFGCAGGGAVVRSGGGSGRSGGGGGGGGCAGGGGGGSRSEERPRGPIAPLPVGCVTGGGGEGVTTDVAGACAPAGGAAGVPDPRSRLLVCGSADVSPSESDITRLRSGLRRPCGCASCSASCMRLLLAARDSLRVVVWPVALTFLFDPRRGGSGRVHNIVWLDKDPYSRAVLTMRAVL